MFNISYMCCLWSMFSLGYIWSLWSMFSVGDECLFRNILNGLTWTNADVSRTAGHIWKQDVKQLSLGVSIETLNLDTGREQVLTVNKISKISKSLSWWSIKIEKSLSRSRNLDFVSTPPSSLKSLNRDQEICWDMTFFGKSWQFVLILIKS